MTNFAYKVNNVLKSLEFLNVDKILDMKDSKDWLECLENIYDKLLRAKILWEKVKQNEGLRNRCDKALEEVLKNRHDAERFPKKIITEIDCLITILKNLFIENIRQSSCYICGEEAEKYCRTCNFYFCVACNEEFHSPYQRKNHEANFNADYNIKHIGNKNLSEFLKLVSSYMIDKKKCIQEKTIDIYTQCEGKINEELTKQECPACKAFIKADARFCNQCGKQFKDKEDFKPCPTCNTLCKKTANFCPKCNTGFNQIAPPNQNQASGATRSCPQCTVECEFELNFCPVCNYKFEKKFF